MDIGNKRRLGFTLIELLVVITIVGIIAAILIPVFLSARERGRRTVCQSNLKQMTLAVQQYVQDNGSYPVDFTSRTHVNPDGSGGPDMWQHLIFPYIRTRQVFYCPSLPADAPAVADPIAKDFDEVGYFYDWGSLNRIHKGIIRGVKEEEIPKPAVTPVFQDVNWNTEDGVAHFERDVTASCGTFGVSTLHDGGANYSFVDGHVKWLSTEATGELYCANWPLPSYVE